MGSNVKDGDPFREVQLCLAGALREKVFPGAVLLVGKPDKMLFLQAVGHTDSTPDATPVHVDTIFDLASLTKPLSTALAVMLLVQEGRLSWGQSLGRALDLKSDGPIIESGATLTHLLSHCSGLPAFRPYYFRLKKSPVKDPKTWIRQCILKEPLLRQPGHRTLYSDPGFILLEWVVEQTCGRTLDRYVSERIYEPLRLDRTGFFSACPGLFQSRQFASTGWCRWRKRRLIGEVHDRNAFIAGGVSGHAGLFSDATGLWRLVGELYRAYRGHGSGLFEKEEIRRMWKRQETSHNTTWALGFDTPQRHGSSAGDLFPTQSVGHLGYTGVSFWMALDSGITVILLTNRTAIEPRTTRIRSYRPLIYTLSYQAAQKMLRNMEHDEKR